MTGTPHDNQNELRALHVLQDEVRRLQAENSRLEQARHDAQHQLDLIRSGVAWRALARVRHVRSRVLPAGSRRDRLFRKAVLGTDAVLALGIGTTSKLLLTNPRGLVPALRLARMRSSHHQLRYQAWQQRHQLTAEQMDAIRAACQTLAARPVISLLMPVYNISAEWLQASVDSVRQQLYPLWELCVIDDASTAPHIGPMLEGFAAADSRIKLKTLNVNENISGASNHALAMATGEFVAPLDHDDALAPNALYEVVKRLNDDPTIDVIYTDHDMISSEGERHGPFFKPDWSPDLLLSMNYVTHFAVHRRALVVACGGFRKGFEGSQDYDLVLRTTEQARRVAHVPLPLYSWGQPPSSVASDPKAKPYAHEAGRRALQEALARRGVEGEVLDGYGAPFRYRVKRAIIGRPLVSIIIPTRNNWRILKQCVHSLESLTQYRDFEIVIVDNRSDDADTVAYLKSVPHRVILFDEPFNFSRMNNAAATVATGAHLLFLNDDTEVIEPGWLDAMLEHSQRAEVGAVGSRLLFHDDTLQHAGVVVGLFNKAGHAFWGFPGDHPGYYDQARVIRNYSAVTGACLMVRRSVFEEIQGFDEAFDISYNDIDLCLRIRQRGYLVVYTPYALLYHYQSATRGAYNAEQDLKYEELLRARWKTLFEEGDPYYNPNLTITGFDFSLR